MLPHLQPKQHTTERVGLGAFILASSLLLYAFQDSFVRSLPDEFSVFQIVFFRSLFSLLPLLCLSFFEQKQAHVTKPLLQTEFLKAHIFRATVMFASLCCYFLACQKLPLASLYSLSYTSPLFVTLMAAPLLGEVIGWYRITAVIVGFLGVLVVMQPGSEAFQPSSLLAVFSGFLTGSSIVLAKRLTTEDSNTIICFYYTVVGLIVCGIVLPFVWITPTWSQYLTLLMVGFFGGIAQFGFIHASRIASASSLAPFDYVGLLWAILLGYIFWDEVPTSTALIGSILVVAGGLVVFHRSSQQKATLGF